MGRWHGRRLPRRRSKTSRRPNRGLSAAGARLGLLGAVATGSLTGCTDYKPGSDTFSELGALQGPPGEGEPDWSCLREAPPPPPPPGVVGETVIYSLQLIDLSTLEPYAQVPVRACGTTDVGCAVPVADVTSDEAGWVHLRLREYFEGYLEINSPSAVPYIFYLPQVPLRTMTDDGLLMISRNTYAGLLAAFDLEDDPTLGGIAVRAFDCQGDPAAGVTLTSAADGLGWYFDETLPSVERQETDRTGLGGFIGSKPGVSVLEAKLPDGTSIVRRNLNVRAGWMTAGYLKPIAADE